MSEKEFDRAERTLNRMASSIHVPCRIRFLQNADDKTRRELRAVVFKIDAFQATCKRIERTLYGLVQKEQQRLGDSSARYILLHWFLPENPFDIYLIRRPLGAWQRNDFHFIQQIRAHFTILRRTYNIVIDYLRSWYKQLKDLPAAIAS